MAGDWLKWTKGLADKREVVLVSSRLERDRNETAGRLMRLWEWCDDNIPDSDIDRASGDARIDLGANPLPFLSEICGLPGMAELLASDAVRWISLDPAGYVVFRNLGRHNGATAKTRATATRKKQRQRSRCPDPVPLGGGQEGGLELEKRRVVSGTHTPSHPTRVARAHKDGSFEGTFEGHDDRPGTPAPNPVAPFAIALNGAGFRCTTLNPDLIAYVNEGGTVDHLLQVASHTECAGKAAGYVLSFARRELAAAPSPIQATTHRAQQSKSETALRVLEDLKHGGLASGRDFQGPAIPVRALAGPDTGT